MLRVLQFFSILVFSGCATLPDRIALSEGGSGFAVQEVFVSSSRPPGTEPTNLQQDRNAKRQYLKYAVSVPPTHEPGQIEWPDGPVDPKTDFTTVDVQQFGSSLAFLRAINAYPSDEVTVFVHGYNTTSSEALYRFAQIGHDFEIESPRVLFSWPSAGSVAGYLFDRDSVLFSRDPLVDLLTSIGRRTNKKIILLAHSMGAHLTMEALRQLALTGRKDVLNRLRVVILLAPDIDPDIFRSQSNAIGRLPDSVHIMTNRDDKALNLSAFISIGRRRVGDLSRARDVSGLNVTLFDFTALADGSNRNHLVPFTSPPAIAVLRDLVNSDRRGEPDLSSFEVGEDGVIRAKPRG